MIKEILNDQKILILFMIGVIIIIMSILTKGKVISYSNLSSLLFLVPEIAILSLGIMLTIIIVVERFIFSIYIKFNFYYSYK